MALASQQQRVYFAVRESPAEKQLSEGLKVRALRSPGFTSLWDRAAHAPLGAAWAHCKGPLFEGALQKTTCVCVRVYYFFPSPLHRCRAGKELVQVAAGWAPAEAFTSALLAPTGSSAKPWHSPKPW